jgi:hypothetical protein
VALAAGTNSPLSPTIRIRWFGVRFDSNLCTRPVRSTLWAPICRRPSTTLRALGLPLLVHNLCGRPILYLVGHKRPPSLIIGAPLPNPAAPPPASRLLGCHRSDHSLKPEAIALRRKPALKNSKRSPIPESGVKSPGVYEFLDKAISVQRKVGYLQMMEQFYDQYVWRWETQLDEFRAEVPLRPKAGDPARKHSYITSVGPMFVGLNVLSFILLWIAKSPALEIASLPGSIWISRSLGIVLLLFCAAFLYFKRDSLINGRDSGPEIKRTRERVLDKYRI